MWKWVRVVPILVVLLAVAAGGALAEDAEKKMQVKVIQKDPQAPSSYYDFSTEELVIEPVSGRVEIDYDGSKISALKARIDRKEDRAVLSGSVQIEQEDLLITGETVTALLGDEVYTVDGLAHVVQTDKVDISADWIEIIAGSKDLKAKGKVKVVEKNRIAWADEVEYSDKAGTMVLTGNVRLEEKDNNLVIKGQKIVINLKTDRMTTYGPWEAEVPVKQGETAE